MYIPRSICVLPLLLLHFTGKTQTTNISDVINIYSPVTAIGCNSVTVNSSSGFGVGDRVLLIQMKGATINHSNTLPLAPS